MITEKDILNATAYINGEDIYNVGALVESFKVSSTAITNNVYQGKDSTNFNVLSTIRGMRAITLNLFYKGSSKRELALKKSKIDNALGAGKIDLALPDGFSYFAFLTSAGEEQVMGVEGQDVIALCTYTLEGIRHDDLQTLTVPTGNSFYCESLIEKTDCRLTCTASSDYASLVIGPVTITNVHMSDVLVVDGINKRILQNGAPCAGNMSFIHFPHLIPGENTISCIETLTVEYYPTY